jgi:hypothetical protein
MQGSFLDVTVPTDDVRPHERRRDDAHDGNSDDPEAGGKQIHTASEMNVRSENAHNVSMVMFDRPHVVEVHALKNSVLFFYRKKGQAHEVSGEQSERQEQDRAQRQAAPTWVFSGIPDNTIILKHTSLHLFHRRPSTCMIL